MNGTQPQNSNGSGISFRWVANGLIAFLSVALVSVIGWGANSVNNMGSKIDDLHTSVEMMDYKVTQLQGQAVASDNRQAQMQGQFTDLSSKFTELTGRFADLTARFAENSTKLVQLQTQLDSTAFKASTSQDWIAGTIKAEQGVGTIRGSVPVHRKHKQGDQSSPTP